MLYNTFKENAFGDLKGPSSGTAVYMVIIFIGSHLKEFSIKYAGSRITNEKGLTQKLCSLLNLHVHKENHPFWFEKEYMEEPERGDSPQVDFGVISSEEGGIIIDSKYYSNSETFFSIETKRLCKISQMREKEYLIGRIEKGKYKECGGVERFKKEIHGKGLKYGAIIGYMQEHNFDYWFYTINSWIDELIKGMVVTSIEWTEKDKLIEDYKKANSAKFKSENSRKTDSIILFHLWVNLVV